MKESQKGTTATLVLAVVVILVLLGFLCYGYVTKTKRMPFGSVEEITTKPVTSSPTSQSNDVTITETNEGFLSYKNSKYGIEFEYPSEYDFSENTAMSQNFVYLLTFCLGGGSCVPPFDDFGLIVATKDWYDGLLMSNPELNKETTVNGIPAVTKKSIPTHMGDETLIFIEHGDIYIILSTYGDRPGFERVLSTFELHK